MFGRFFVILSSALCLLPFSAQAKVLEIRMTADGFAPATLEIDAGDSVKFLGDDDAPHWPASDAHPTHTVYPGSDIRSCGTEGFVGFDACMGIERGGVYRYTFSESGEWRFHDHLQPQFKGVITVAPSAAEEQSQYVRPATLSFGGKIRAALLHQWYAVFPQSAERKLHDLNMVSIARHDGDLEYWVRVFGFAATLAELEHDSSDPSMHPESAEARTLVGECHMEAHFLGRIAYRLNGIDSLRDLLNHTECQLGFYHGVIEISLGDVGDDETVRSFAATCVGKDVDPVRRVFCDHVIGHGLMVYHNYDLPGALNKCIELVPEERDRTLCYHGVFMENIFVTAGLGVDGHETAWIDPVRPDFPCTSDALPKTTGVAEMCYFNQSLVWGSLDDFDVTKGINGCERAPKSVRTACFLGIGFNMAIPMQSLTDDEIATRCVVVPQADRRDCLVGAIFMRTTLWRNFDGFRNVPLCAALGYGNLDDCDSAVREELSWLLD